MATRKMTMVRCCLNYGNITIFQMIAMTCGLKHQPHVTWVGRDERLATHATA